MKHLISFKKLWEYVNYTDDAAKNIPEELRKRIIENYDEEFQKILLSMKTPKMLSGLLNIMTLGYDIDAEYKIGQVLKNFTPEESETILDAMNDVHELAMTNIRNKVGLN
jgi:hypothetical protein